MLQLQNKLRMLCDEKAREVFGNEVFIRIAHAYCDTAGFAAQLTSAHGLIFVLRGQGQLKQDGQLHVLKKGNYFYYTPGMQLNWSADKVTMCRFTVKGNRATKVLAKAGIKSGSVNNYSNTLGRLIQDRMLALANSNELPSRYFPVLFAWEIISGLSRQQAVAQNLSSAIKEIIDESFHEQVHINELADRLAVNRSTLFRQFKQAYGVSPKEYMDQCRFERAKELLVDTKHSIADIAGQCGFSDHDHFSRRFKELFKQQPSVWRSSQGA